jgi:S-adenosylmethionine:tRNA ribosyltransferase-isomerase
VVVKTADFHYDLPPEAIAQAPIEPRDAARLLVVDGMRDQRFAELPALLSDDDLVVVNRTRVRRARLIGVKDPSGGRVEALLLSPLDDGRWEALVRPARRLRAGTKIRFGEITAVLDSDPEDGRAVLALDAGGAEIEKAIEQVGEVPLPPYYTGPLSDPERYQTVFAGDPGSAAAPTAGLHFTAGVLSGLEERGIAVASVDLDIGLDTFRPIATDHLEDHRMHRERYRVSDDLVAAVTEAHGRGGRVVAIGTTVVRALESAAASGVLRPDEGATSLFITPGYRFGVIDVLVTNFHLPSSTLVVLVAAFMGDRWRAAYAAALDRGYRFLSFGDAMLVERTV